MTSTWQDILRGSAGINEESWEGLFAQARDLHQRGVDGDQEAVKEAHRILKKLRNSVSDNPLVEAYFGSALSLLARDEIDPMERMEKANKGMKALDRAVAKAPDEVQIRIMRGYVCFRLPEFIFHRTRTAVEDFAYLIDRYEQGPGIFGADFYLQLLYDLGLAYQTILAKDEAESTWQKLREMDLDGRYRKLLKEAKGNGKKKALKDESEEIPREVRKAEHQEEYFEERPHWRPVAIASDFSDGFSLYERALKGDPQAATKAADYFEEIAAQNPGNILLQAIYQDCLSLVGRFSTDNFKIFGSAIKGTKALDALLEENRDSIELRFIRAYHSYRLPEAFFNRSKKAIEDFKYLAKRFEEDPSIFPQDSYWQLLLDLGMAYKRIGMDREASMAWEKLWDSNPEPYYQQLLASRQRLDNIEIPHVDDISRFSRKEIFRYGVPLHDLAVIGHRKAVRVAFNFWEMAAEEYPEDSLIKAYYGSSMALMGKYSTNPQDVFGHGIKGMKMVKEALAEDPDNHEIRLLEIPILLEMPDSFFHQTSQAMKEIRVLIDAYQEDPRILSKDSYHEMLYTMGSLYEEQGNEEKAKKIWSELLADQPHPKYTERFKERVL